MGFGHAGQRVPYNDRVVKGEAEKSVASRGEDRLGDAYGGFVAERREGGETGVKWVQDHARKGVPVVGGTGGESLAMTMPKALNQMAGTKLAHVPYRGTATAINDLLGGQIQLVIATLPTMYPQVKANRLHGSPVALQALALLAPSP